MRKKEMLIAAIVILSGTTALAAKFQSRVSGAWGDSDTWEEWVDGCDCWRNTSNVPATGDKAIARHFVFLASDEVVGCLDILAGADVDAITHQLTIDGTFGLAALDIRTGGDLLVGSGIVRLTSSDTHTIDGRLFLDTSTSILRIDESLTLGGDGRVIGQDDSAKIQIQYDKTLTAASNVTIEGRMKIQGLAPMGPETRNGALANNGTVSANAVGILQLMSGLVISGSGVWHVGSDTASDNPILLFNAPATALTGAFQIRDAGSLLDINQNVTTTADIIYDAGEINTITNSSTFTFGIGTGACVTQPVSPLTNQRFMPCP